MESAFIDNQTHILKDDLIHAIQQGDTLSMAGSVFSMYAFEELHDELQLLDEFRFIYTQPTFLKEQTRKEQREFYIPRLSREQGLYGTELEIKLRNELTQKAVSADCARWIKKKAHFKSTHQGSESVANALTVSGKDTTTYIPCSSFTVGQLGVGSYPTLSGISRLDTNTSSMFLEKFNQAWSSGDLEEVTEAVIENIEAMYQENAPELVYYLALYRIFHEFLDDTSQDNLAQEGVKFREAKIWNMLYDFQKDAALSIINKLQTYNGCILADSVGLGKTFTALAVIKYYELLNRDVLVLCPKKLSDNWLVYKNPQKDNPVWEDGLHYRVACHTDLSRKRGVNIDGLDLQKNKLGCVWPRSN